MARGCAEVRAGIEAGMRDLNRSETRREIPADQHIQVRDSSHVGSYLHTGF